MKKLKYNISMIIHGMKILINIEKTFIILQIIISVLSPLIPYINIYMMAKIIDQLAGTRNIGILISYVIITVLSNMILSLTISILNRSRDYHIEQFYKNEKMYFAEKTMTMDYENVENRDVNLLYERIQIESQTGYNAYYLYTFLGQFISSMSNIAASSILTLGLFANGNILLLPKFFMFVLIITVVLINYYSTKESNRLMLNTYEEAIPFNAQYNFYNDYFNDYNAGKDIRLYSMEDFVVNQQKNMENTSDNIFIKARKKTLKYVFIKSAATDILNIAAYIFVVIACIAGSISIGSIAKYVSCISLFIGAASDLVNQTQSLISNNKYLKNYFRYLNIPSKMYQGTLPIEKNESKNYEIEFKNVSFKYPETNNYVLKNLNMKIKNGERMAVVGMNGSGKTTMIKLLCRLYDPTEGEITINGIDIKKYKYDDYLCLFSVVFQDFKLFSFPLGQNLAASMNVDRQKACDVLKKSGFKMRIKTISKGLDTPLYNDFDDDGIEISGGEAQKIAFARALYKDAPIIVLDEPTAALDPIAEYESYSGFDKITGNKTVIYISHRLSFCRLCDDIAVFDQGRLIQRGDHNALAADKAGKYYELWNAQAQYYR